MTALSKILLPVDFSERSAGAGRYACSLASHFGSELILLHVLTPPHYEFGALEIGGTMLTELYTNRNAQVTKELDSFLPAELANVRATRVVIEGDPARKIVEYAHQQGAGLIVMPTHGYGPFRRFILGSNTAKVLHDADCPVWTGIHMEEAPPVTLAPFHNILCGLDLGSQSGRTLKWAMWLQQEFDAKLTVVHATQGNPDVGEDGEAKWRMDVHEAAEEELLRLQQETGAGKAELLIECGEPSHVLCSAAKRVHADVMVIGRGSASGVFGRLRTNAYAIIRESSCPVVSV